MNPTKRMQSQIATSGAWRVVLWFLLGGLLSALTVLGFRGYLSPGFLIGYATSFMC